MSVTAIAFGQSVTPPAVTPPVAPVTTQKPTVAPSPAPEQMQPRRPPRRATTPPARVMVIADKIEVAPQVVTIVHRLTGVKMLRMLLRQGGERGTLFTIDPDSITSEAHASIIAGLALEDGKTIAARLPQAGAEIEFMQSTQFPLTRPQGERSAQDAARPQLPRAPAAEPDLTVITRDGRRLRARYVGLDGQTGLSVLQIVGVITLPQSEEKQKKLVEGQAVQLFAPQRTTPEGESASRVIFVRMGMVDAKITKANIGKLDRFTVKAAKLTPVMVGGVACDESGNTLGIVDAVEGNDARIVSAESIRAASKRVLAQQTSVPRPLLGVRGEPVEFASRSTFTQYGWSDDQLREMVKKQVGILLTSVLPGSPAALAKLQPGDVIVRVNQEEVASAEEFSELLGAAGSGKEVRFSVRRPTSNTNVAIQVKLGSSFEPLFKWHFDMPIVTPTPNGLQQFGVETMALSPKVASQLGAQGGLLVVAVQPESRAAKGGLREGDVIETIDGRVVGRGAWTFGFPFNRRQKHVVSLVREREKKQVILEPVE